MISKLADPAVHPKLRGQAADSPRVRISRTQRNVEIRGEARPTGTPKQTGERICAPEEDGAYLGDTNASGYVLRISCMP